MNLLLLLAVVQAWQPGAPMPTPGYGFACVAANGRVYAIGGTVGGRPSAPRVETEAYDVAGDTWYTGLARLPVPRWFSGAALLGEKIYVIGGSDGRGDYARVDRYDPATNSWDTVASLPGRRSGPAACVFNGELYVIGGYGGDSMCEWYQRSVLRYLPDGGPGAWVRVDSLGTPRSGAAAAVANGRMNVVGGRYYSSLASMEYYRNREWQPDNRALHDARSGLGLVSLDPYLYAIGGSGAQGQLATVETVNVATGHWGYAQPLPSPRSYAGAAVVGNVIVVIGGRYGTTPVNEVQRDTIVLTGIEENPATVRPTGSLPTVVTARALLSLAGTGAVFDQAGMLVTGRDRPLAPGVYFLCRPGVATARFAVVP